MYANQQIEQLDREGMQALQLERLQKQLKWAEEKSFFYQQKFAKAGVTAKDIQSLEDVKRLPFLTSNELYQIDSLDILTMPLSGILRFSVVQQENGEVTKLYTNGDIAHNVEMMTRSLVAAGINQTSVVALQGDMSDSRSMDIQYALEMLGATVVAMGTDYRQWLRFMELVSMDTIISTPQLIMQLIIQLQATGKNIADYPITRVICRNQQGLQNAMQRHIADRTHATVYNFYEPAELGTASMLFQCEAHKGYHIQEDYFYPEIVAFHSDQVVTEPHQMGELVVTTLMAEAMPLIRYRTGQAVMMETDTCDCGRTLHRVTTPFTFM
ncbi:MULTISPECIES: phenylacetate--CoA ligase family protein [Selenomonas]|jgi:phenylacetate-CoA ligase|uniref:Phenylacetate-CoA ligase n=1 Tax=Selenomonas ruminantium TaxID=971 RepID=A0A1I0W9Q0_SELRU|nr:MULTISPECIES: phenylacetate--CoA ligase family protein [Selenomonas]SFA85008.1 phenylacetate-CoA ligase [Selenomonas ruminantium]